MSELFKIDLVFCLFFISFLIPIDNTVEPDHSNNSDSDDSDYYGIPHIILARQSNPSVFEETRKK